MIRPHRLVCSAVAVLSALEAFAVAEDVLQRTQLPPVCSAPSRGTEGRFGASKDLLADYVISQVQVLSRHGARSSYHHIPNVTNPHLFSCVMQDAESSASLEWSRLFEAVDADSGLPLAPQPSWFLETASDGNLCAESGGILRPEGVRQLLNLGKALRDAYGPFLHSLLPQDVYIRAGQKPRVLLSVASFLLGILGGTSVGGGERGKFQIRIHSNISAEAMEGLPCPRGMQLTSLQDRSFAFPPDLVAELGRIFKVRDFEPHCLTVDPDIADVTYTSQCDGGELPCGPGGCIDDALQVRLAATYDAKWLDQYSGSLGGAEASRLTMQPLLAEVAAHMHAESNARPKLAVYVGRDLVIGPVAAALGIFDGHWPPFSAHLVFELWSPRVSAANGPVIRVLHNGEDVTSLVNGCGGAALCSLSSFDASVRDLLAPYASHDDACRLEGVHKEVPLDAQPSQRVTSPRASVSTLRGISNHQSVQDKNV